MALTKVTGQVIKNTTDVTVGVLTVTNTLAVGGTVSIGGTLTYEDVTNVDSVGLITARDGIVVGSGITLSKDGDIFATGVTTSTTFSGTNATFDGTVTFNDTHVDIADSVRHIGDSDTKIRFPSDNTFSVETAGDEALRINSNQRVLLNHNTPRGVAGSTIRRLQIEGTGSGSAIAIVRNSNNTSGSSLNLGKSRSGSTEGTTIVQGDDKLGVISFAGADGTNLESTAAQISGEVDGTPGENDMPGRIVFKTTSDGSASSTERVRITSAGKVGIGTTNPKRQLHVYVGDSGFPDDGTYGNLVIENDSKPTLQLLAPNTVSSNIHFGDNDNGQVGRIIYDHPGDKMFFFTQNNERVTITSNGLGIGTTAPQSQLHISSGNTGDCSLIIESDIDNDDEDANPKILFRQDGGNDQNAIGIGGTESGVGSWFNMHNTMTFKNSVPSSGGIIFMTGNVTGHQHAVPRLKMHSSGAISIGGDLTQINTDHEVEIQPKGTDGNCSVLLRSKEGSDAFVQLECDDGDDNIDKWRILSDASGGLRFQNYGSGSWVSTLILTGNTTENLGQAQFENGSSASPSITFNGDTDSGFYRINSNIIGMALGGDHKHRFEPDGDVIFGGNAPEAVASFTVLPDQDDGAARISFNRNNTTNMSQVVRFENANTAVGSISYTNSTVTYDTGSDYRLKLNDTEITDGITRLKKLRPIRFNWKIEPEKRVDGFFAHEVSPVVPNAISGEKDKVVTQEDIDQGKTGAHDKVGDPMYQTIDHSKLVPLIVAALKEEILKREDEIQLLKERLNAAGL